MSDLSGLSSIGGTLSALQDTGLREFIETNSGSWTGGVEYSAISGSIAPSGFAFFTAYRNLFADVSAAVAAGKICYAKSTERSNIYRPLVYFVNGTADDYYGRHLAVFGNVVCQTDAWSATGYNRAGYEFYSVNGDLDPTTTNNGWHYGRQTFVGDDDLSGVMYKSAIGYDGDGKISGYNGSAFAGGGETPDLSNYVPYSADTVGLGYNNTANERSFALGSGNSADNNSIAIGRNNTAYYNSLAIGFRNNANTYESFALGSGNTAANFAAFAHGNINSANDYSLTQGESNSAKNYSIAQGYYNIAKNYSQAFGWGSIATDYQMSIGKWNKTSAGASFVIGDGTYSNRSDTFVIFSDGSVSAKGNISANGVELGGGAGAEYSAGANIDITDNVISGKDWTSEITAATEDMVTTGDLAGYIPRSADNLQFGDNTAQTRCFALGSNVSASDNSLALGQNNSARSYSIALGGTNIANGLSLSIGGNNSAQVNSLAVGNTNSATTASEAVGYYNTANDNSLTVGQYNSAGSYSIAVGYQSRAYWNSIALSNGSANTGSLAIGGNAHTGSIAIGSNANSAANYSQALGYNVSATDNCMAIGKLNATTNAAFVIGNGYTASTGGYYPEYHYSDAFIIDHSGNVSAAGKISANGVELVSFPSSADDVCQAVVSNSANWGDIPTKVVATSADATGSNILYVVTGE